MASYDGLLWYSAFSESRGTPIELFVFSEEASMTSCIGSAVVSALVLTLGIDMVGTLSRPVKEKSRGIEAMLFT